MNTLFEANLYSIDTSSTIAAFHEHYPIKYFPTLWQKIEKLIQSHRLKMSQVVFEEAMKDPEIKQWCNQRQFKEFLHEEVDLPIQEKVREILAVYPRLVDSRSGKSGADPWCVAYALITENCTVITEENPTNSAKRPKIPDVCLHFKVECIKVVDLIKREKWVI